MCCPQTCSLCSCSCSRSLALTDVFLFLLLLPVFFLRILNRCRSLSRIARPTGRSGELRKLISFIHLDAFPSGIDSSTESQGGTCGIGASESHLLPSSSSSLVSTLTLFLLLLLLLLLLTRPAGSRAGGLLSSATWRGIDIPTMSSLPMESP